MAQHALGYTVSGTVFYSLLPSEQVNVVEQEYLTKITIYIFVQKVNYICEK